MYAYPQPYDLSKTLPLPRQFESVAESDTVTSVSAALKCYFIQKLRNARPIKHIALRSYDYIKETQSDNF